MNKRIEITLEIEGKAYQIDYLAFMGFCPLDKARKRELTKEVDKGTRYFIIKKKENERSKTKGKYKRQQIKK